MLGLGNSISAGWSAINNDVKPLVNKLEDFICHTLLNMMFL